MAIKITISNKVGFPVKGVVNDADGAEQDFDFSLTAHRLQDAALNDLQKKLLDDAAKNGNHQLLASELGKLLTNWKGVRDESDAPMAYDEAALGQLLDAYKGLALLIWHTYNQHVGARAKN